MIKNFKAFILRGNVVDLAVGIVIGAAFVAVIQSFVKNLLTPLVSIPGKSNFDSLHFKIRSSDFRYGAFLNDLIAFLIVAAAVYFFVVVPVNALMERSKARKELDLTTRECPECMSEIPKAAKKCAFCASELTPVA